MAESDETTLDPIRASLDLGVTAALAARRYRVRVMGSGFGLNYEYGAQWFVPDTDEGIGSAVRTFGGAKVHWSFDDDSGEFDHSEGWTPRNEIGYLSDLAIVEGALEATLHVHDDVPSAIADVIRERRAGLSIEAHADRRLGIRDGKKVVELINFRHGPGGPASVALVTHPALSGEILRVAASRRTETMSAETKAPESADPSPAKAAGTEQHEAVLAGLKDELEKARKVAAEMALERKQATARETVTTVLASADLPATATAAIKTHFDALIKASVFPSVDDVQARIDEQREVIKSASKVEASGLGDVQIGAEPRDKMELRLENLFSRNDPKWVRKYVDDRSGGVLADRMVKAGLGRYDREFSLHQIARDCGKFDFANYGRDAHSVRAAITTSQLADALENVQNKRFLGAFENPMFDWRKLCRVVPVSNFRKQERIVRGGYPNLAAVSEGAAYTAITSFGDEGHGYTPSKRGNLETITRETILNDDVGIIGDVPIALGTAAVRTLYEFVADFYKPSGTSITMDYDSVTLFSTSHSNKGTATLSATSVIATYKLMLKQADLSNSKRMLLSPKLLLVPIDLMNTAFDILKARDSFPGGSTDDYAFIRNLMLEACVIRHWTDATDWTLAADPLTAPGAEVGFILGQEEPEIFIEGGSMGQDILGLALTNDKARLKVRHEYGGTIQRHETVYAHVS